MSSAYFAPLVLLPALVTAPGKYRTRGGETVEVDIAPAHIRHHAFDCCGSYPNGVRERWHRSGRIFAGTVSQNDIVAGGLDAAL